MRKLKKCTNCRR